VPLFVSFILGYAILKRRVKGAYFAILTQALAVAFATLLIATIKQTGGFNGLNTFTTFFGQNLYDPDQEEPVHDGRGFLIVCLVVVWQLYRSRYGELLVATRDAEERVRFLGYDPANIKLMAFVVAAVMASIGGALFAPHRRHHLAVERRRGGVDHVARRRRPRWSGHADRSGAGGHRRRLRPVHPLGAVPDDSGPTSRARCSSS
jgi:ABC-type branched-subunit amino acid transport system permease subunit